MLAEHNNDKLNPITLNVVDAASKFGEMSVLVAGSNVSNVAEQVNLLLLGSRFISFELV